MRTVRQVCIAIITILYIPISLVWKFFLKYTPVRRKQVLFSSFPDYSDNSKALYLYMLNHSQYADYSFVWLIQDRDLGRFPKNDRTKFIHESSDYHYGMRLSALAAIASSEILFYTHSSPLRKINEKKRADRDQPLAWLRLQGKTVCNSKTETV